MPLLAFIPSPSNGAIEIGPLSIHVYGILLAIGIVVASIVIERRWVSWGHDRKQWQDVVIITVIFGIVGARLYHVATDSEKFEGHWGRVFEIWNGGLSIWGAVIGGVLGLYVITRIKKYDFLGMIDALAVGLVLAQAIGRFGNYFNQELFGEPTTLPWGLEIDRAHRPPGFEHFATFHPTFLYESIYCVAIAGGLIWIERRRRLKRGQVFALYVIAYTFGRFWLEQLRIDDAKVVGGLRVNSWIAIAEFIGGIVWFWWLGRHSSVDEEKYARIGRGAARTEVPSA
jgi:prolipoprotein diacylglyceryl transferase